ncbi:biotin-dependent carboxyltransferase family protein [Sedimentitalea sp. HM32M-2]|uniref:5-oxoprolinase subunit C family protein n=1 Tax=Sedimentitalea sp. HM32M-2 TaxID=3351566 RepID=UPI003624E43A
MTRALIVHRTGPGLTVQDQGRPGYLAFGLSRGGAADRLALAEGAALLAQDPGLAALEMAGTGGEFEATQAMRIALTGAPMQASVDGHRIAWNASHLLPTGSRLTIGGAESGTYGYLHLGGGLATPLRLGARGAHLTAGLGAAVQPGTQLPVGPDGGSAATGLAIQADPRFVGGEVRIVPSLQTEFFDPAEVARFAATRFRRDTRGNRMGARFLPQGPGFHNKSGLHILSEVIIPGDIQITGDGTPFVLLCECQTTGGYPRIGSVLPADLPRVAQARPGTELRFRMLSLDQAIETERRERARHKGLLGRLRPLIRDPANCPDLLSQQFISGVTNGDDLERDNQ